MRARTWSVTVAAALALAACTDGDAGEGDRDERADDAEEAVEPVAATEPVVELAHVDVLHGEDGALQDLISVAEAPDGTLVGRIRRWGGDDGVGSAVVRSSDGHDWEIVDDHGLPEGPTGVRQLVALDDAVLALGGGPDGPAVWRSEDGEVFEEVDDGTVADLEGALLGLAADVGDAEVTVLADAADFINDQMDSEVGFALLTTDDGTAWELVADHTDAALAGTPSVAAVSGREALVVLHEMASSQEGGETVITGEDDTTSLVHVTEDGVEVLGEIEDLLGEDARVRAAVHDGQRWVLGGAAGASGAIWTAEDPEGSWQPLEEAAAVLGGQGRQAVAQLLVDDGRLMAAGSTSIGGDAYQREGAPELWWEDDEGRWHRSQPWPDLDATDTEPSVSGLLRQQDGEVLLYGSRPEEMSDEQRELIEGGGMPNVSSHAAAWVADRAEREVDERLEVVQVEADELVGEGEQYLYDVVATDDGLVAVGWDQPDLEGPEHVAVWRSPDGLDWERVAHQDSFEDDGEHHRFMRAVTVAPDGALVAVGHDYAQRAALVSWRSEDGGETWEDATTDGGGDWVQVSDVSAVGDEVVAVGSRLEDETFVPLAWRSADGLSWEELELPGPDDGDHAHLPGGIHEAGGEVLVTGTTAVNIDWLESNRYSYGVRTMLLAGEELEDLAVVEEAVDEEVSGTMQAVFVEDGAAVLAGSYSVIEDEVHRGVPELWRRTSDGVARTSLEDLGDSTRISVAVDAGEHRVLAGGTWIGGTESLAVLSDAGGDWVRLPHDREVFEGDEPRQVLAGAALGDTAVLVGTVGESDDGTDGAVWLVRPPG